MKHELSFEDRAERFAALARLMDACEDFEASGQGWGDLQVNDPRYRAIQDQNAGRQLDELSGYDAMRAARRNLFSDDEERTMAAGSHRNHLVGHRPLEGVSG